VVDESGLLSERRVREVAEWYSSFGLGDVETFEAAIMLMRAHNTMISVPDGPTRDVGRARYGFLRIIYQANHHRMLLSEIGEALDVSPTHVTKIVDGLVEDGLIQRVRDAQDKRRIWAELTDDGKAVVERVLPEMIDSTVRTWRLFTRDEKRLLAHLATKLRFSILMDKSGEQVSAAIKHLRISDTGI